MQAYSSVLILVALILFSNRSGATNDPSECLIVSVDGSTTEVPRILLTYKRHGGFSGNQERYTLYSDGRVLHKGLEWNITSKTAKEFLAKLASDGIFNLRPHTSPPLCCDRIAHAVTAYRLKEQARFDFTDGDRGAPAELKQIAQQIETFFKSVIKTKGSPSSRQFTNQSLDLMDYSRNVIDQISKQERWSDKLTHLRTFKESLLRQHEKYVRDKNQAKPASKPRERGDVDFSIFFYYMEPILDTVLKLDAFPDAKICREQEHNIRFSAETSLPHGEPYSVEAQTTFELLAAVCPNQDSRP